MQALISQGMTPLFSQAVLQREPTEHFSSAEQFGKAEK